MTHITIFLKFFILIYISLFFDIKLLINFCIDLFGANLNNFFLFAPLIFNIFIIIFLVLVPKKYLVFLRNFSFISSLFIFFFYCFMFIFVSNFDSQFTFYFSSNFFLFYNINLVFAVDGINIFFLILISLLIPICILLS